MRSFPSKRTFAGVALGSTLALAAFTANAEPPTWFRWLPVSSPATDVLYRLVPGLLGPTAVRRPPSETAPALADLSLAEPSDTQLIELAAREFEAHLDFVNAEAQWVRYSEAADDAASGQLALADYYHRRVEPDLELGALRRAAGILPPVEDPLVPPESQRAWRVYERMQSLVERADLDRTIAATHYSEWVSRYPEESELYTDYFDFLAGNDMAGLAAEVVDDYERAFPGDPAFAVRARAKLAELGGSIDAAIAVYDEQFDPLWPRQMFVDYFDLLDEARLLYDFYDRARRETVLDPLNAEPVTRVFRYLMYRNDSVAAGRELAGFRVRREGAGAAWSAAELRTFAELADLVDDHDEAIRYAYALYSLPGADASAREDALVKIISVLLEAPDRPIRFGRDDLSFYRDIATLDASPGFLNGILSLLFNSRNPGAEFAAEEQKSEAYFHRARADQLYRLLSESFPDSVHRSGLLARLIDGYAVYGKDEAIITHGTSFVDEFSEFSEFSEERTRVALQVADAYARLERVDDELDVYERLLGELAATAGQLPIGNDTPRSFEYAQVLDRHIARLTALDRVGDAVLLYRREIDRNPDDPGLYDRLAGFLGANERGGQIAQVYREAMARFQEPSWWHKLARFYLRNREDAALSDLSHELIDAFSGSEVGDYVSEVIADRDVERRIQVEINRYALDRFPHDVTFVRNLIGLYSSGVTANPAAMLRLMSDYWHEDEGIRRDFFEGLAAQGALGQVADAARASAGPGDEWAGIVDSNPAVARFVAEAEAWQSHFEEAAPIMKAVADAYPADAVIALRASDVFRSIASGEPDPAERAASAETAVAIVTTLSESDPRNREWPVRAADIHAEHGMMEPAASLWDQLPGIEPGATEGYIEAATLYWDYLRPQEALDWIERGRSALRQEDLWAYEAGAILESLGRPGDAVREYVVGAFGARGGLSESRLTELSTRSGYRDFVDEETDRRVARNPDDPRSLQLKIDVLRAGQRFDDLASLLDESASTSDSRDVLALVRRVGNELAMVDVEERVIRRGIELEPEPSERIRREIELASFFETRSRDDDARGEFDRIYRSNPRIAGVIRATVDFYWRHDRGRAVEIVRRAADDAHPTRRPDYLVETVWRAIEAGENGEAIEAARDLLRIDPIDGSFIASMVDALAAGGREDEVEALLTSKMEEIEAANISPAEKTERSAALRRGLIPILIGQGRHREALDQFIEIMNRYPDDADLVTEASRHAIDHGLETVLVEYYRSTARQSPSDPRWPIILARVHVEREDYDEAIVAYGLAMAARPERLDLAVARGDLEERTHRFEDAIQTFSIVHTLTREDPVWLERIAVLEARLGRRDAARRTLERAFVEDRPESLGEYARAALVLESVGMMDAAADLIADQASVSGAALSGWESDYARIMTVSRRHEEAFDLVLGTERPDVVRAMGRAVDEYFSPDERVVFGEWLSARRQGADERSRPHFVELASAARLHDLEADWRIDDAIGGDLPEPDLSVISRIIVALEEPRMRFGPLATRLEDLAGRLPPENRRAALDPALGALRTIGDEPGELELIERYPELEVAYQTRYYALLAAARPEELVRVARRGASTSGLMAASALIAAGESDLAVDAIRVDGRTPAWQDAYTGLVGVYFGHDVDSVRPVFDRVLGPSTIGTSLDVARDRDRIIAGDLWFYYGQRYGEYLAGLGVAAADDYLYSVLELRPRDPLAYMELARHFRERGEPDRAITSYRQALELDPDRVDARSEMALAFWSRGAAGDADEARDRWRDALAEFQSHPDPADGTQVIADIRSTGDDALVSELETALGEAMGAAVDSFEVWELPPLVQALFEGSSDDEWLIEVVGQSRAPAQLFSTLASATWPGREQRHVIFENAVRALGDVPGATRFEYRQMRQRYLDFLIDENLTGEAVDLFAAFSAEEKDTAAAEQAGIRLAVLEGTLEELLESYAAEGSRAPSDRTIQETAATLSASGFQAAGGRLSEFLYRRQIAESVANRAAFLGLAEIHLDGGRTDEAIELLRRLDRIAVPPFENLMASARLLIDRGEYPAALEFIERRTAAVPWDADARIAAGQTRRAIAREADGTPGGLSDADLDLIARSTGIPYATRAAAAAEQAESPAGAPGSTGSVELDLLSGRLPLSTTSVNRPFFFASRLEAAEIAAGPAERLEILLAAIAERPDDTGVRRRLFDAALDAGRYHVALAAYSRSGGIDAEIAVGLAEASLAIGEPADAARFFRTAAAQQTDPDVRLELERRQAGAEETYQRTLDDERRRPMMRDDVDQPNLVQRRLE